MAMPADDLTELVKRKIENIRLHPLDLSRRNPLIGTKLGPRSNAHIRVVDELPDILFYKLNNDQELPLVPLPGIDEDPRDESTRAFRDALINARLTDEQYLAEMESVCSRADAFSVVTRRRDSVNDIGRRHRQALNCRRWESLRFERGNPRVNELCMPAGVQLDEGRQLARNLWRGTTPRNQKFRNLVVPKGGNGQRGGRGQFERERQSLWQGGRRRNYQLAASTGKD
jgi:hypothetical protein